MATFREDSDFYCLLWLGIALLSAYYFNIGYLGFTVPLYLSTMQSYLLQLIGCPLILVVVFLSYLRPSRGRQKPVVFALAIVVSVYFYIVVSSLPPIVGITSDALFLLSWGIGSALLVASGFSIMPSRSEITSPGILDVGSLKYGISTEEEHEEAA
jgi:hypothetical protein